MATITAPASRPSRRAAFAAELRHGLPVETWVLGCTVLLWIALAFASPSGRRAGSGSMSSA